MLQSHLPRARCNAGRKSRTKPVAPAGLKGPNVPAQTFETFRSVRRASWPPPSCPLIVGFPRVDFLLRKRREPLDELLKAAKTIRVFYSHHSIEYRRDVRGKVHRARRWILEVLPACRMDRIDPWSVSLSGAITCFLSAGVRSMSFDLL